MMHVSHHSQVLKNVVHTFFRDEFRGKACEPARSLLLGGYHSKSLSPYLIAEHAWRWLLLRLRSFRQLTMHARTATDTDHPEMVRDGAGPGTARER